VTVFNNATLQLVGDNFGYPIGTLTLNGGTLRGPGGLASFWLNKLVTGTAGGTVDFSNSFSDIDFSGTGAGATINGNTNWIGFYILPGAGTTVFSIAPNVTLTINAKLNGGFRITGGGTFYATAAPYGAVGSYVVSQARVRVDDLSVVNGSWTVLGAAGNLTLDGGTLQYSGLTQITPFPISIGPGGATVEVSNPLTTLTLTGTIGPDGGSVAGPFTKSGPGVLILNNSTNTYVGGITVGGGVLAVGADAQLGAANPIVNPAGTLRYTATDVTSRTFNLNGGTLEAPSGVTLTLNGAAVNGGFLRGTGTFALTGNTVISGATTYNSTSLNQVGPASLTNFTNGGAFTNAAGQTLTWNGGVNQGFGRFVVNGTAYVSDFTTTGNVSITGAGNLLNTGTSPLVLGGGSVTTVGVYNPVNGQVTPGGTITIGAQDLVVQGGFLRNNGIVTGPGKLIVDYGGLAKGAGDYDTGGTVLRNGGVLLAGNSPGLLRVSNPSFTGGSTTGGDFNNATGTVGGFPAPANNNTNNSGWSAIEFGNSANTASGLTLQRAAAGAVKWQFRTTVNDGVGDTPGNPANFSAAAPFQWLIFRPRTNAGAANPTPTLPTDQINTVATITLLDSTGATLANTNANLNQVLAFDASLFRDPATGLPISPSVGLFSFAFGADLIGRPGTTINLIFTPVPEPMVTFGFAGLMVFATGHGLRRRGT
jgi:fibronectin-binding autotransporter adhesin